MGFVLLALYVYWLVTLCNKAKAPVTTKPYLNHGLHILLTILSAGLWLFFYIPLLILHGNQQKRYLGTHS